jgi:hypothetical protein
MTGEYTRQPGLALENMSIQAQKVVRAYDQEQEKLATYKGMQVEQQFQTQQTLALDQAKRSSTDGAPNLAKDYMNDYQTAEDQALKNIDPTVAAKFAPRFDLLKQHFTVQAYSAEQGARDNFYANSLNKNIDDAAKKIRDDPSSYPYVISQTLDNINATTLPEDLKQKFRDNITNSTGPTALFNADNEANPRKVATDIGLAVPPGDGLPGGQSSIRSLGLSPNGPMATITTNSGAKLTVAAPGAHQFANFIQALEAQGYNIDPSDVSSFRPGSRVAGTGGLSFHSVGAAIDLNASENRPNTGSKTDMPANVDQLAKENGLIWGGHFGPGASYKDSMHFKLDKYIKPEDLPKYGGTPPYVQGATPLQINGRAIDPSAVTRLGITNPRQVSILNDVRGKAQEIGFSPDVAAATLYLENHTMDPGDVSATGMRGLYQLDSDHSTKYGETSTIAGQINAGVRSVQEREASARAFLGREPQPWETYLFHYQGEGGAAALLKADPAESVFSALSSKLGANYAAKVIAGNPDTAGKSVGAFLDGIKQRMNNALAVTGGAYDPSMPTTSPAYAGVSYDTMQKFRQTNAATIQAQDNADFKAQTDYLKIQQDGTQKDLTDLLQANKLTPEAVATYRDVLTAPEYQKWMKTATDSQSEDPVKVSNFPVYKQIRDWAADPDQAYRVKEQATQAVLNGFLSRADYDKLNTAADKTIADNQPGLSGTARNQARGDAIKELYDYVNNPMFKTQQGLLTADGKRREFDAWYADHPQATYADIDDKLTQMKQSIDTDRVAQGYFNDGLKKLSVKRIEDVTPEIMAKKSAALVASVGKAGINQRDIIETQKALMEVQRRIDNAKKVTK